MGCVASRSDKEERVRVCKERKRLMKQLLRYRKEFADAQIAYLRSLRNTGVTLRQFTEPESLEVEETVSGVAFPPSPPPPLPPSPPPPPTFSPDLRKLKGKAKENQSDIEEEIIEIDEESGRTPPPPVASSSWEYWDVFGSASVHCAKTSGMVDEDNWKDTNTEFIGDVEDEEEETDFGVDEMDMLPKKDENSENVDDNSSVMSWHTKDTADTAMVVWRGKKSLSGIIKDLDEYFLKASAVVKDIAVFIDINAGGTFLYQSVKESKRRRSSSAKVFTALNWSWSSKSLQSSRETGDVFGSGEPCKPGAHCITLEKLYSEEQKLYKDVKEVETAKVEYGRKSLLLQKQDEEHDWSKAEKTRLTFESLESQISSLQESISRSSSTILTFISKELQPQLMALASGLMHMWQTMYNSHQLQSHISQQLNHLTEQLNLEPTTESRQQAAAQLHTEVTSWYNSFSKLVKYQKEYVRTLCKWTELINYIESAHTCRSESSTLHAIFEKWQQALDNLPDKMVSEAIKCLQSAVESIILQQQQERNLHKRSDKLGRKLEREVGFLAEVEIKFAGSLSTENANATAASKHPLVIRRAKAEALKSLVDDERVKYMNAVKTTRTMIMSNLQTSLPKLFEALMVYSSACSQSLEAILGYTAVSESDETQTTPPEF